MPLEDGSPGPQNAVLIFSLEMMEEQLMSRMVATAGRVNMQMFMSEYQHFNDDHYYAKSYGQQFEDKMKTKLETQFERAQAALRYVKELPVYSTTESGLSPNAIKSMVMQKQREIEKKGQKLALIVIDYLQLMTPNLGKANASRTEEVGDMSRKTKLLAKEFDVPVLLLAQLNRDAETNEAPSLKHLRESGSIEQDADKVMFIWSEHAEMTTNEFQELPEHSREEALRREQMKVKINVAKNRQGNSGNVDVIFDKGFQTFVSQSSQNYSAGETFDEFCAKYYHKTRSGEDLFWPIRPGDLPDELEEFREPEIQEQPWLQADGNVVTMTSRSDKKRTMTVQSASVYGAPTSPNASGPAHAEPPANKFASASDAVAAAAEAAVAGQAKAGKVELDRSMPKELPEIDDIAVDFGEEDDNVPEPASQAEVESQAENAYATLEDAIAGLSDEMGGDSDYEDEEELDLDALDALERLGEELE